MSSEIIWILAYNNDDGFQHLSFIYIYIDFLMMKLFLG
jgi:hypothetical protein